MDFLGAALPLIGGVLNNQNSRMAAREARDWSEDMYNKYNSPAALVRQYEEAGINPALMFGGNTPAAPMETSPAETFPLPTGSVTEMLAQLMDLNLLDAQRDKIQTEADRNRAEATATQIANSYADEKIRAEIDGLVQSAEGQRLANQWNPKLWQNELDNGRVNRASTIVGIQKALAEIEKVGAEIANINEDTRVKAVSQGLIAAQTALANQNTRDVSATAWRKEFENAYTELYGHKPDEPIWNAVTSIIGTKSDLIGNVLRRSKDNISGDLLNKADWISYILAR